MNIDVLHSKIADVLRGEKSREVRDLLNSLHPSVTYEALRGFSIDEMYEILELMDFEPRIDLFCYLSIDEQTVLIERFDKNESVRVLKKLPDDERTDILQKLPPEAHDRLLFYLSEEEREEVILLESYPNESVGSIMTSAFIRLDEGITAGEALEEIRKQEVDAESIYYLYVCNDLDHLLGVISLRQLVTTDPSVGVQDLLQDKVITVSALDTKWSAVITMRKTDLVVLPVLNNVGKMVGIVTHDDLEDAAEEEVTDDFHRMAGAPGFKTMNLRTAHIPHMVVKRLPWLLILVFMNVFSGAGIAYFEETIEAMVSLVFFLPLLIDSGGNAGSQAATLMVRSLALGDVRMKDWLMLFSKEIVISLLMGVGMAFAVGAVAYFRAPEIIPVVTLTMVLTVMMGSLMGMLLPFIFTRFKMDAATASAPLITSIADICGVLIYFSIATRFLGL